MVLKHFIVLTFLFFYLNGKPLFKLTSPEGKEMWLLGLMHYGDIEDTLIKSLEVIEKTKPIGYYAVEDFERNVLASEYVNEMESLLANTAPKVQANYREQVTEVTDFWPKGKFWEEDWKNYSLLYVHNLYIKHLEQHNVGSSNYVMSAEKWIQDYLLKANPGVETHDLEPTTPDYRRRVIHEYEKIMDSRMHLEYLLTKKFSLHDKDQIKSSASEYKLGWMYEWEPNKFFIKRNNFMVKTLVELVDRSNDEGIVFAAIGYAHICGENAVQKILGRHPYNYTVEFHHFY